MSTIQKETQSENRESKFLDIETIRRRVAMIKNNWSEETAAARAAEGERRRQELQCMLLDLMTDVANSEESCDLRDYGFSLVG